MLRKTSTRTRAKSWIVYCSHYCRLSRSRSIETNREAQSIENLVKRRNLNLITIRQLDAIVTTKLTRKRFFIFSLSLFSSFVRSIYDITSRFQSLLLNASKASFDDILTASFDSLSLSKKLMIICSSTSKPFETNWETWLKLAFWELWKICDEWSMLKTSWSLRWSIDQIITFSSFTRRELFVMIIIMLRLEDVNTVVSNEKCKVLLSIKVISHLLLKTIEINLSRANY